MTVGERIRQRRLELELTQEELAKRLGYKTRTAISNVEKGKEDLTTTRVRKFADALGVTPEYLMGWDDPNKIVQRTYKRRFNHCDNDYIIQLYSTSELSQDEHDKKDRALVNIIECISKLNEQGVDNLETYLSMMMNSENFRRK